MEDMELNVSLAFLKRKAFFFGSVVVPNLENLSLKFLNDEEYMVKREPK